MDHNLGGQLDVLALEQQDERIGSLLSKARHERTVIIYWFHCCFSCRTCSAIGGPAGASADAF